MPHTQFETLAEFETCLRALPCRDDTALKAAIERNASLTKPAGALGRLEEISIWYASWRGDPRPEIKAPQILIFAGNHGVAAQGVSAFPTDVTAQMVLNFNAGGAAINQLAHIFGARLDVFPLSLDTPTADFTQAPAMTEKECVQALKVGWENVSPAADLVVVGEMGIANTTASAAIAAALYGGSGTDWAGRGTGVDDDGLSNKARVIDAALTRHRNLTPLEILAALGGREIAAITGAIAGARAHRIPVLIDGFISTAAAAVLEKAVPGTLNHCQAAHVSAESAHRKMLEHLGKKPLLALDMRLGEGSGAALAIGILKGALACHSGMASFNEAGVTEGL